MFQHDNAQPHVKRICTQFLEAENVPVLPWPARTPDMSPIDHVWDALDQRVRQRVPVPANIQQLHTAIKEEWDIPQPTIHSLIKSMQRRCAVLHEANGGTFFVLLGICDEQTHTLHDLIPKSWALLWSMSPLFCYNSLHSSGKGFPLDVGTLLRGLSSIPQQED
jgi:hypothetical protein